MDLNQIFTGLKASRALVLALAVAVSAPNLGAQAGESDKQAGNATTKSGDANVSSTSPKPEFVEDVSTPSLKGSDLKAVATVLEVADNDPAFTRELTRVQWRPADPIDLYIIKPSGVAKPPVVLYLYSYPFETDRFRDAHFCRFLASKGFAAVGFASALTGQRYHDVPMKEWFVSELRWSLAASAHDVQMILNYLATHGDVDMDRVGMFGDGSGATIAILAAAVDPRIKVLDLLDPWGDWPDWMAKSTRIPEKERPDFLKPDFLAGVAPLDPLKWLPELKTQKVRLQEVKSVTVTPEEARQKIEKSAPANLLVVRYDDHQAFVSAVASGSGGFDWIKEQLNSTSGLQDNAARSSSRTEASSK